jgi:hypothetical protein
MTTLDLIAEERRRYMSSAKSHMDWFRYVTAVERLRTPPEQQKVSQRSEV